MGIFHDFLKLLLGITSLDLVCNAKENFARGCSLPRSWKVSGCNATASYSAAVDISYFVCIFHLLDCDLGLHSYYG